MAQVRVFEAAKKYGYEVQELIDTLVKQGVKVRSHLSPVDEEEIRKAVASLGGHKGAAGEVVGGEVSAAPKAVLRRRKAPVPEVSVQPPPVAAVPAEEPPPEPVKAAKPAKPAVENPPSTPACALTHAKLPNT